MVVNPIDSLNSLGVDIQKIELSSILSSFHEGILITDQDGVILYYNQSMGKVDDLEPGHAIGKTILDVYDLTEGQSPTMRCLSTRTPILNEPMFYRTHLGKVTNAILNVYPLFCGSKIVGAICFVNEYHMVEKKFSAVPPQLYPEPEKENGTRFTFSDIIGRRSDLSESVRVAKMASDSTSPVLIAGETGTGKELFAQSIHNFSTFSTKNFVPINCAAIPENLLEGILFGTSKGAFTGAIDKAGLFEQANGGSLFLDELNSMPLSLQSKLLRVIQEKKVRRIGSHKEVNLNLKIISSVNKDPYDEINRGRLRVDLFYRLGVVFIKVPSLRERANDLSKLIYHFIDKYNIRLKKNVSGVSDEVQHFLYNYHWPGNVRELEHVIEGAMNFVGKEKVIEKSHLPQHFLRLDVTQEKNEGVPAKDLVSSSSGLDLSDSAFDSTMSLQQMEQRYRLAEKQVIRKALSANKGNIARAVRILGLASPQALQYKMKKLGIHRSDFVIKKK